MIYGIRLKLSRAIWTLECDIVKDHVVIPWIYTLTVDFRWFEADGWKRVPEDHNRWQKLDRQRAVGYYAGLEAEIAYSHVAFPAVNLQPANSSIDMRADDRNK